MAINEGPDTHNQAELDRLWQAIQGEMGICPSFFKLSAPAPEIAHGLFSMARLAYLDSPIPAGLKERLFTFLSRFCSDQYCVTRHSGFLLGKGYVGGAADEEALSPEEVVTLLSEPFPESRELDSILIELTDLSPLEEWPEYDSRTGYLLRIACAMLLLVPDISRPWCEALKTLLTASRYEQFMLFLAFVRTAHFWSVVHPELSLEDDLEQLLSENEELANKLNSFGKSDYLQTLGHRLRSDSENLEITAKFQEAYKDSERRLRFTLEAAGFGEWVWDEVANKSYRSARHDEIFGYPEGIPEWNYQVFIEHVHPDDRDMVERRFRTIAKNGAWNFQCRIVRKDGEPRWISVKSSLYEVDGLPQRLTGLVSDITERMENEKALQEAKAKAESASQAKSDFLANMSHEIRTPLNAIVGISDLLRKDGIDEEKQDLLLSTLRNSSDTLLNLINDLLDISKIEERSFVLDNASFQLDKVLEEVTGMLESKSRENEVSITVDNGAVRDSSFVGDRARLRQILINVMSNAIKFTNQGEVTLRVVGRTASERCGDEQLEFHIEDTGIGIPESLLETIFDKFSRGDNVGNIPGTGLGLSITRHLLEMMGGSIEIHSEVEVGTKVILCIPGSLQKDIDDGAVGAPPSEAPETLSKGGSILLVEDIEANIIVLTTMLEKLGLTYRVARDGEKALSMLKQYRFDLVLMDVNLPKKDGLEATRELRAWEQKNGLEAMPIVAMTAHALSGDKDKCLAAGMNDYLTKPLSQDTLRAKINEFLDSPQ